MEEKPYIDVGQITVDEVDDANIPVDIWLKKVDFNEDLDLLPDGDEEGYKDYYLLTADCYMLRKSRLAGERPYAVLAKDRQVLVDLVHKHWLPLYKTAVEILTEMKEDDRGVSSLYYWKKRD